MAEQSGIIPLRGTLGNINFFRNQDGYKARTKTTVNATRIASDPAFARTRENGYEFSRAGKAGKLIRTGLNELMQNASDKRVTSRLMKELMKVVKSDTVNARGERTITAGNLSFLTGFEFNIKGLLSTTLFVQYGVVIDRVTGQLTISFPLFVPINTISAPTGATHFKINTAALEVNFDNATVGVNVQSSAQLAWDSTSLAAQTFVTNVTPASTDALILLLGIEFYQEVNGVKYSLKNGSYNALSVVGIDQV